MRQLQPLEIGLLQGMMADFLDRGSSNGPMPPEFVRNLYAEISKDRAGVWITEGNENRLLIDATQDITATETKRGDFAIRAVEMIYDKGKSLQLRRELIRIRDNFLANNYFDEAVVCSHVIAWMFQMMEAVSVDESSEPDHFA